MEGIYIITVAVSFILSTLAEQNGSQRVPPYKRPMNAFVHLLILFYIIVLGFRYLNYIYSDEWIYRNSHVDDSFSFMSALRPEGLGSVLVWLSDKYFSKLGGAFAFGQFYILSTSIIVSALFIRAMWDYSEHFAFSVFLFVTMGFALSSMNIIRQFVAVSILFYGFRFLKNGNFLKYAITVLIATGFHTSAIVMIPLYFVIRREKLTSWTWIFILLAFFLMGRIGDIGEQYFGDSRYAGYFNMGGEYGVKLIRIMTTAIPSVLVVLNRRRIYERGIFNHCEMNMIVFTLIVSVFSLQNVYYNRISAYFSIICLTLFPELPKCFGKSMESAVSAAMIVLFFLFGLYQAMISPPYYNIIFDNISGGIVTW